MAYDYGHPSYLGLQIDWPLFIVKPFTTGDKTWEKGEPFNWPYYNVSEEAIANLYLAGFIHHDKAKEKVHKVGDRLNEMNSEQLYEVYTKLNNVIKNRCATKDEFNKKRCKGSKIDDKQRGLIRQFLRNTKDIQEDFEVIRDQVLGN